MDLIELLTQARSAERRGAWEEAWEFYEKGFSRIDEEGDSPRTAELLLRYGIFHRNRGDLASAEKILQMSHRIAEAMGSLGQMSAAVSALASLEQVRGNFQRSEELFDQARQLAEQAEDPRQLAIIDQNLGIVAHKKGDLARAVRHFDASLIRFIELGERVNELRTLNNLARTYTALRQWIKAEHCLQEAMQIAEEVQDVEMLALLKLNRAEIRLKAGAFNDAEPLAAGSFEVFSRIGSKSRMASAARLMGITYRETGRNQMAEAFLTLSVQLARAVEDQYEEAESEMERSLLHVRLGRSREAVEGLTRAHHLYSRAHASGGLNSVEEAMERVEQAIFLVVAKWGESIESKDLYTAGHCQRVADYASALASALGFDRWQLKWVQLGGFLHDVGKVVVPPEILNKPGKLTRIEWELMRLHVTVGDEIVSGLNFPLDIRPLVRSHHERWDGAGYPDGLSGEEIPLLARILCIADVYDALTTVRSYKTAFSRAEALKMMSEQSGRSFDPNLLGLFIDVQARSERDPSNVISPYPE